MYWDIAVSFEKTSFVKIISCFDIQGHDDNLKWISGPTCHWLCLDICKETLVTGLARLVVSRFAGPNGLVLVASVSNVS